MDRRPTSPSPAALFWLTFVPVLFVGAAGALCIGLELSAIVTWGLMGAIGLVGCLVAFVRFVRHARALRGLENAATRMLDADLPTKPREPLDDPSSEATLPSELRPLARAMRELGERMRSHLKEVAKKSRNLEALIDAMDEPLLVTDNEDRVILCSRSAEAILDAQPGGLVGRPIRDVFTNAEVLDMHGAAKHGQVRRGRVRMVTPLGSRAFQVSGSPVPAAWGAGVFGAVITLRDVTELAQAVQVKTDFVANASHELRTPVAAIRSAAETLEAAADDPAMTARLRTMIISHADRLEEMLRDLLDLSRLESPDVPPIIEPVDIVLIEHALVHLSQHACAERKLELSFEFDEELRGLRTDRKLLALILRNLVENATKFAHEGTAIRIVGQVMEEHVPRGSEMNGTPAAPGTPKRAVVRFDVIDHGVGIPLDKQERVFERYYQVDTARTGTGSPAGAGWKRGTGLGLAIVKHAAKALGGRAWLSSVWGQGTTVSVEFHCELTCPEPRTEFYPTA